jgi:hypothetical protein
MTVARVLETAHHCGQHCGEEEKTQASHGAGLAWRFGDVRQLGRDGGHLVELVGLLRGVGHDFFFICQTQPESVFCLRR